MSEDRFEGTAKKGIGRVQDAVGGLVGDDKTQAKGKLNEASGSIQDTYGKVKDQASDAYGKVKDQASDAYGKAKDQASDVLDQARSQGEDVYEQIEAFVREQPLAAVGVGLGVGLLIGMLLRGGRKTVYVRK